MGLHYGGSVKMHFDANPSVLESLLWRAFGYNQPDGFEQSEVDFPSWVTPPFHFHAGRPAAATGAEYDIADAGGAAHVWL